jgi:hypothetical protein
MHAIEADLEELYGYHAGEDMSLPAVAIMEEPDIFQEGAKLEYAGRIAACQIQARGLRLKAASPGVSMSTSEPRKRERPSWTCTESS